MCPFSTVPDTTAPRPPQDEMLPNPVLEGVTRLAVRVTGASVAVLCRPVGLELAILAQSRGEGACGLHPGSPVVGSLCGYVSARGEPLSLERPRADLRFHRALHAVAGEVGAFLGTPLPGVDGGVLAVTAAGPRVWSADEALSLAELAATAAAELERAWLADALRASATRYDRLLSTLPDALYVLDETGRLRELNEVGQRILGRSLEEARGMHFHEFVAPEDRECVDRTFLECLSGATGGTIEARVVRPSGERRLLTVCRAPIVQDVSVVGILGVARDITDERAREMQFRRAERMASIGPLLSSVCHELNNPLTSIKSFAELMLLDERPAEDREALEIVQRESHRAAKIVSDLRVVARQARDAGSGRGMVGLNALVDRVLEQRAATLADGGIRVDRHLDHALPAAWAVEAQMEQVLHQLLSNAEQALKDHPQPRVLTLRTHRGSVGVVLHVEDSGPGIPEEHLDRIFDPFWTTRRPGEGTGLGLSLVHGIVSDHGGCIRVDSRLGRGTAFSLDLPVADAAPVALGETESESPTAHPLRLLVVDDEAPIRFSLQRYMERRGHQVEQAAEGEEALRLLDAAAIGAGFDIILADLRMPGLDGERLLQRLRDRGDGLEQRVIFITGDQDSPDAARVLDAAGVPVVQKPFELAEIAQIVETHAGMLAAF